MNIFEKEKEKGTSETQHEDYIVEAEQEQAKNIDVAKGKSSIRGMFENPYV